MQEEFRKIEGCDNYSVSNYGRVRNDKSGKIMKLMIRGGYQCIGLYKDNKIKKFNIHRLVAIAFIDNPDNKPQVDHIDNNRVNNQVDNLRWVTNHQNQMNSSIRSDNTSGIKGVDWHKKINKWRVRIAINGKNIHIGYYNTIEEAALARRQVAEQNFGDYMNACEKAPIININIENAIINN